MIEMIISTRRKRRRRRRKEEEEEEENNDEICRISITYKDENELALANSMPKYVTDSFPLISTVDYCVSL